MLDRIIPRWTRECDSNWEESSALSIPLLYTLWKIHGRIGGMPMQNFTSEGSFFCFKFQIQKKKWRKIEQAELPKNWDLLFWICPNSLAPAQRGSPIHFCWKDTAKTVNARIIPESMFTFECSTIPPILSSKCSFGNSFSSIFNKTPRF